MTPAPTKPKPVSKLDAEALKLRALCHADRVQRIAAVNELVRRLQRRNPK